MKRFVPAVLLACLVASASYALEVTGELTVKRDRMVKLAAKDAPAGAALIWDVSDEDKCDIEEHDGRLRFAAPPGTYKVKCRAISLGKDGKLASVMARVTVTVEGEADKGKPPEVKPPEGAPKADPEKATAKLRMGSSGCTATPIWPRRPDGKWDVLSAAHCTRGTDKGTITLKDGRVVKVSVAVRDVKADVCWLVTESATLEDLPYAVLAKESPSASTEIWHVGYGVDRPGNREEGTVVGGPDKNDMLRMLISVSSGDSGSAMFRKDTGEVVATLYGTMKVGGRTVTIGGGCVKAWELRPGTKVEDDEEGKPVPLPCLARNQAPIRR